MGCHSKSGSEVVKAVVGEGRRGATLISLVISRTNRLSSNG
jgi:hypothetical protein